MKCENCGCKHDGSYASGRFCSNKCAKGFSTKAKRKEINEKVRKKLSKNYIISYKICPICGTKYKTNRKTCSVKCGHELSKIKNTGKKHNMVADTSKMGGFREGGGKAKQISYTNWLGENMKLNKEEIKVAKILDEKQLNWKRNTKGFPYTTLEGKPRKYYPDFVVNENKYIEYKGWVTEKMNHKMKDAVKTNDLDLLIIIGDDPRYQKFGIPLKQFENEY